MDNGRSFFTRIVDDVWKESINNNSFTFTKQDLLDRVTPEDIATLEYDKVLQFYLSARFNTEISNRSCYSYETGKYYDVMNGNDKDVLKVIGANLRKEVRKRRDRYNYISKRHDNMLGQMEMEFDNELFVGFEEMGGNA